MTRREKIKRLNALQSGRDTIANLFGQVVEFWTGSNLQPGAFTNEQTGKTLTASQLQARRQAGPHLFIFETIKTYE